MPKFSKKVAKAINSTAIAYSAMNEALVAKEYASAALWAMMLIDAQTITGVEVIDNDQLAERRERYLKQAERG